MPVRKITRIALLSAILYVSKVALEFLPNVELVSLLTVLYTLVFGKEAFLIVTVFNLFEQLSYNYNNYLSVDELKNTVLMNAKTASEKSVTSYISRLRSYLKKINTHHFDIIHSANGYKLVIF